ncbi:MAG: hypothetical protein K6F09_03600 [Clostridiales bacterium]|nr:hypothetical protein [Clostridiales bacterium]
MVSVCPKCGGKLRIFDWKPNCPHCGVNLVYYGLEERLQLDADKAEAEHAVFQKRLDRLKSAYAGSKLSIVRIIMSVLPIAALFLPIAKISFNAPFISENVKVSLLTVYNVLSGVDFDSLFDLFSSPILGKSFILFALSLVFTVLSLLMVFIHLVLLFLSASKRGRSRNFTLNFLALIFAAVPCFTYILFIKNISTALPSVVGGGLAFGSIIYILLLCGCVVINALIFKQNVPVKYKETFIGGIPSERYFEMIENDTPISEIRAEMARINAEKQAAEAAEKEASEAAEKASEEKEAEAV